MDKIQKNEATKLRILVKRDGEEKANLTFPIFTLTVLDTVMPEKALVKCQEMGLDLKKKIQEIRDNGNRPQIVFEMGDQGSSYKVWIE